MTVSIITPVYNMENYIEQTIDSVRNQRYDDWEMFIVDDGSTDDTVAIVEHICTMEPRIKLVRQESNKGQSVARNVGLRLASGRYVTFIDGDDCWEPDFLSEMLAFIRQGKKSIAIAAYERCSQDMSESFGVYFVPEMIDFKMLMRSNYMSCLTTVYDTKMLGKRYFTADVHLHEDYMLWLSMLKEGHVAHGLNKPLAKYRIRRQSVSRNKWVSIFYVWKVHSQISDEILLKRAWNFLGYIWMGIKKNRQMLLTR